MAPPGRLQRVLVANRGEIATKVIRTCSRLGLDSVAVFTEVDANMPYVREATTAVCIGAPLAYLDPQKIIGAAKSSGADAIHPGYGFLSENSAFARAVEEAGLIFIGPTPDAIDAMGLKIKAKELLAARAPEVPLIPGFLGDADGKDPARWVAEARRIGYPVLVKASAGGGGRGLRVVEKEEDLPGAVETARAESERAFSDGAVMLEKFFSTVRHIEVQIFGDAYGEVVHLLERECSIQRRNQKVIEESPSPFLDADLRRRMGAAAVRIGQLLNYRGAGTVEFVVDPSDGGFYFLEVNTRLQVEHPVSELVCNLDLVAMQLLIADGVRMRDALAQARLDPSLPALTGSPEAPRGYAVEVRVYSEDFNFVPGAGKIALWSTPPSASSVAEQFVRGGIYFHNAVETGSEISVHYDNMICKLVAYDHNSRLGATRRAIRALKESVCFGLTTNKLMLLSIMSHPDYQAERAALATRWIRDHEADLRASALQVLLSPPTVAESVAAACIWCAETRQGTHLRNVPAGWSNLGARPTMALFEVKQSVHGVLPDLKPYGATEGPSPFLCARYTRKGRCFSFSLGERELQAELVSAQQHGSGGAWGLRLRVGDRLVAFVVQGDPRQVASGDACDIDVLSAAAGLEVSLRKLPRLAAPQAVGALPAAAVPADEPTTRPATQTNVIFVAKAPGAEGAAAEAGEQKGGRPKGRPVPSPLMAKVLKLNFKTGDEIKKGDVVVVVESMKMETKVASPFGGKVTMKCKAGDQVPTGKALFFVE